MQLTLLPTIILHIAQCSDSSQVICIGCRGVCRGLHDSGHVRPKTWVIDDGPEAFQADTTLPDMCMPILP